MKEVNDKKKQKIPGKNVQVAPAANISSGIKQPQKKEVD